MRRGYSVFFYSRVQSFSNPCLFMMQNLSVNNADTSRPHSFSRFSPAACFKFSSLSTRGISEASLSVLRSPAGPTGLRVAAGSQFWERECLDLQRPFTNVGLIKSAGGQSGRVVASFIKWSRSPGKENLTTFIDNRKKSTLTRGSRRTQDEVFRWYYFFPLVNPWKWGEYPNGSCFAVLFLD